MIRNSEFGSRVCFRYRDELKLNEEPQTKKSTKVFFFSLTVILRLKEVRTTPVAVPKVAGGICKTLLVKNTTKAERNET